MSVIYTDNDYGVSVSNTFADSAMKHGICINKKIGISTSLEANETVPEVAETLLNSRANVVVLFIDNNTALTLFEELSKIKNTSKFVWIASDEWMGSQIFQDKFSEITRRLFAFQLNNDHVKEFDDYFSQLTPNTNIRNPFFSNSSCNEIFFVSTVDMLVNMKNQIADMHI